MHYAIIYYKMNKSLFFKQYNLYLPRWWLVILLLVLSMGFGLFVIKNVAFYLATTQPKNGEYLVVEGWQSEASLQQALAVFNNKKHRYQYLITTGGPDTSHIKPQYETYAEQSAAFLLSQGLDANKLIVIATPASAQDRTFLSAVMVRDWLNVHGNTYTIDVFSQSVHAKRTHSLYKMAFHTVDNIGIYASVPADYDLSTWWQTSNGAKSVVTELAGMVWVTCCFNPGKYGTHQEKWGLTAVNE